MVNANKLKEEDRKKIKNLYQQEAARTSEIGYVERELNILRKDVQGLEDKKEKLLEELSEIEDLEEELEESLKEKYNAKSFNYQTWEVQREENTN